MLELKATELVEEMEGFKEDFNKYMMSEIDFEDILDVNPASLKVLRRLYDLMEASTKYIVDEAKAIDNINEKLDLLISMQKD